MLFTDFSKTLIVDATASVLKIALCQDCKVISTSTTNGQAMECFFQALSEVCANCNLTDIEAIALCTGTGSILGTRTASVGIATIVKFSKAKIFEYNCMEVASHAIALTQKEKFSLFTPSRKGFVNILNFNEKIELLKEIKIDEIQTLAFDKKILLKQRNKIDSTFADFEIYNLDESTTANVLKHYPQLATICHDTPDAKPLTEREYVKWKAQAHI